MNINTYRELIGLCGVIQVLLQDIFQAKSSGFEV